NGLASRVILRPPMFALQPEMKVFSGSANRELAQRICNYIGVPLGQATISAFPDGETYVKIEENIRGRDVFIIQPTCPPTNDHLLADDLTETAGTLTAAATILKKHGALDIYAAVAHAVLVDVAIPRLQKSEIKELVTTNSTPVRRIEGFPLEVQCVSELLGEGMKRIHNDESVSSLFKIDNDKG